MKYQFDSSIALGKINANSDDRFPCAVCGKSYLRKRHLQRHMRDECIGIPPRFSCDLCPSRFRRKYHMVRHLTSKHNIQPSIAQQAGTSGIRMPSNAHHNNNNNNSSSNNNNSLLRLKRENSEASGSECTLNDSSIPENLSLRKEQYEQHPPVGVANNLNIGSSNMSASPTYSGGACSSSGTQSPLPLHLPLPTYGLTGAITAISAAAAAANLAAEQQQQQQQQAGAIMLTTTKRKHADINEELDIKTDTDNIVIKTEPISPGQVAAAAAVVAVAADEDVSNVVGKMEDDWKMKLSLQLISNSLLKERLLNTIPFGTGYNNN